ncbi:hypothetical protein [Comamonas jiangduensis]
MQQAVLFLSKGESKGLFNTLPAGAAGSTGKGFSTGQGLIQRAAAH